MREGSGRATPATGFLPPFLVARKPWVSGQGPRQHWADPVRVRAEPRCVLGLPEAQPPRRGRGRETVSLSAGEQAAEVPRAHAPRPGCHQRGNQAPNHLLTERVGLNGHDGKIRADEGDLDSPEVAHDRPGVPWRLPTKRGEVLLSDQRVSRQPDQPGFEPPPDHPDPPIQERLGSALPDCIPVEPRKRGSTGVEAWRGHVDRSKRNLWSQQPAERPRQRNLPWRSPAPSIEAAPRLLVKGNVDDLGTSMDPPIGPACHAQAANRTSRRAANQGESFDEGATDRSLPWVWRKA